MACLFSQRAEKGFLSTIHLSLGLAATKSLNRGSHGHGNRSRHGEGTSSDHLSALLAVPNTGAGSLHGVLAAESAGVAKNESGAKRTTCCAGSPQSSSQSYGERNRISFRTFRKYRPS